MKIATKLSQLAPVTELDGCRVCGGDELLSVLDLGEQHIGNAFHPEDEPPELVAPLDLVRCADCSMVQLRHSVDSDLMYESYWYRSGVNRTMREHLQGLIREVMETAPLASGDIVIDIGCNDGTALLSYPKDVRTVGVDPSNIRPARAEAFVNDYFSAETLAGTLRGRRARIITSIAMFYDLNEPDSFVQDIRACLADDGIWVLELSYLPAMLRAVSYDTICHEHVCYYRLSTFERVLQGSGMELFDVEFNDCNGGSFRIFVAPDGSRRPTERLARARLRESAGIFDAPAPYVSFKEAAERSRDEFSSFLHEARAEGKTVYGYGASTKGQVTLQYAGVTTELMVAIAERNPDKYGLFTPGTKIPICSEAEMRLARPDYLVALPWHFISEFLERERDYLAAGGKLVVPLPEFRIYSAGDGA